MLRRILFILVVVSICAAPTAAWEYKKEVDVVLVLAADVSPSIDSDEWGLQVQAYAAAFRSREVLQVIRDGSIGSIAVTFVQWGGTQEQSTDWYIITGKESAEEFAHAVERMGRSEIRYTAIGDAIDFCAKLLKSAPVSGLRKVIDVSGDGPHNSGRLPARARDDAVKKGIIINGLPILSTEEPHLDLHYQRNVIGGPNSFVLPIVGFGTFESAVKQKIRLEIAGILPEHDFAALPR
jgi:hypothetical protein